MIKEKPLGKKAERYADSVISVLLSNGRSNVTWDGAKKLVEAAYFNGFQSGVVWQKQARDEKDSRPFRIEVEPIDAGGGKVLNMEKAVTQNGDFIGDEKFATHLWKKFGITQFELRTRKSKVCSVGYSPLKGLWFGWSHRAIKDFATRKEAAKFAESVS